MSEVVYTTRPAVVDKGVTTRDISLQAYHRTVSMLIGLAIEVQNTDGSGKTAIGFNPATNKLARYTDGGWVDLW